MPENKEEEKESINWLLHIVLFVGVVILFIIYIEYFGFSESPMDRFNVPNAVYNQLHSGPPAF